MDDGISARDLLVEVRRLEAAGRRPRTEVWFPLFVNGAIVLAASPAALIVGREDLGKILLPLFLAGGVACAVHYRRSGRAAGIQAPLFVWLTVIMLAATAAAFASYQGRERDWPGLNLAGPGFALMIGMAVLATWAGSPVLLLAMAGTGAAVAFAITVADGDAAIALYTALVACVFLGLAAHNRLTSRSSP